MRIKKAQIFSLLALSLLIFDFQNCSQMAQIDVTKAIAKGIKLNSIQPALAVRGVACIVCHTQSSSNIVTDYGYGNPWYFDQTVAESLYADRDGVGSGIDTLNLASGSFLIVPKADAPAAIQQKFNITTLADFVRTRLSEGTTSPTQVVEVDKLVINIPSAPRIKSLFGGDPTQPFVFYPDTAKSPALSGLTYDAVNKAFVITKMTCDGDLYLTAPAMLDSATITSINGCRIYTTSSVFIQGQVTSAPYETSTTYNTQILSADAIFVGLGRIIKDGNFCETANGAPVGWYSIPADTGPDCKDPANAADMHCDTMVVRSNTLISCNTYSRAYPDSATLGAFMSFAAARVGGKIADEAGRVEASAGHSLYDASCSPSGRAAAQSRLMLVASHVHDRYNGDFSGSVIAEAAMMSLGTFVFKFDPVFTQVSIFSQLNEDELISGASISAKPISGSAGGTSSGVSTSGN